MGGFSDSDIERFYTGETVTPFRGGFAFRIPKPSWFQESFVTVLAKASGGLGYIGERIVTIPELFEEGDFLFIKPLDIASWDNFEDVSRWVVSIYRRVSSIQDFSPSSIREFDVARLVDQMDRSVRLSQISMAEQRKALKVHGSKVPSFSGEELQNPATTIPFGPDVRGKLIGIHPVTGDIALFDSSGWLDSMNIAPVGLPFLEISGDMVVNVSPSGIHSPSVCSIVASVFNHVGDKSFSWMIKRDNGDWESIGVGLDQVQLDPTTFRNSAMISCIVSVGDSTLRGSRQIIKVTDGSGISIIFDNPTISIPYDGEGNLVSGSLGFMSSAKSKVSVYIGGQKLTPVLNPDEDHEFSLSPVSEEIAISGIDTIFTMLEPAEESGSFKFVVNLKNQSIPCGISYVKTRAGKSPLQTGIESSSGLILGEGLDETWLRGIVFRDGVDVTDEINTAWFKWVRHSPDPQSDVEWNTAHQSGYKNVLVQRGTFSGGATFTFIINPEGL